MSKTRLVSSLAASLGILAAACWMVTAVFPLAAAPEIVADSPGISVELNGAALIHRTPVVYPEGARSRGIQGDVVVQFTLDDKGSVSDAQVLSGPQELRSTALQSVLTWHLTSESAGGTRQATIAFRIPAGETRPPAPAQPAFGVVDRTIAWIRITGLSDQATADLSSRLPVPGTTLSAEDLRQLVETVRRFDEHLAVGMGTTGADGVHILISPPSAAPPARIRVGGNVQSVKLVSQPRPAYPREAKEARIQGVVKLDAIIAKDGTVQNLTLISGHPLLAQAALDAVRHWSTSPPC